MADKAIGSLVEATAINDADRFVLEQSGQAKQISGATMISELAEALDGHGGIQSIDLVGGEGNTKTYRITMTDGSNYDFSVQDGESGNFAETAGQLVSTKYTEDNTTPYVIKACESGGSNRADELLIGGTFAWNQLAQPIAETKGGIQITNNQDGSMTINGTADGTLPYNQLGVSSAFMTIANHKYLYGVVNRGGKSIGIVGFAAKNADYSIFTYTNNWTANVFLLSPSGTTYNNQKIYSLCIDLTLLFGPTIADYIYSLEQATAGAGIAWFRKYFPKPYYAYCAGALYSVNVGHKENTGINVWDEEWDVGDIDGITGEYKTGNYVRSKNHISVIPNTAYYFYAPGTIVVTEYDGEGNAILNNGDYSYHLVQAGSTYTMSANTRTIAFHTLSNQSGYNHDICINRSNPAYNGNYYSHESHSVIFDNTVHLRGIPKLVNGELSFDGNDTYESPGVVTRRYGAVDLGTIDYFYESSYSRFSPGLGVVSNIKIPASTDTPNARIIPFKVVTTNEGWTGRGGSENLFCIDPTGYLRFYTTQYSDAASFKTAMSGVYLVYELASSAKETHDAFDNPQVIYDGGTNYFVDYSCENGDRDVEIPVGHSTRFLANLAGALDSLNNRVGGDMSRIVIDDDLADYNFATKDAVGGTLRQLLVVKASIGFDTTDYVDLSTLSWTRYQFGSNYVFFANLTTKKSYATKGICTKYNIPTQVTAPADLTDKQMEISVNQTYVYIRDDAYSNASAFTAAMKGVLLAYEKA